MKKVLKEVRTHGQPTVSNHFGCFDTIGRGEVTFDVPHGTDAVVGSNELKLMVEVDEPETLKEFAKIHGLKKKKVMKWLNENFEEVIEDING